MSCQQHLLGTNHAPYHLTTYQRTRDTSKKNRQAGTHKQEKQTRQEDRKKNRQGKKTGTHKQEKQTRQEDRDKAKGQAHTSKKNKRTHTHTTN